MGIKKDYYFLRCLNCNHLFEPEDLEEEHHQGQQYLMNCPTCEWDEFRVFHVYNIKEVQYRKLF